MHVLASTALREGAAPAADLELDPALLAFIKWHVTTPLKWEALWYLADREGRWLAVGDVCHGLHVSPDDAQRALADLAQEGVLEERDGDRLTAPTYRLPTHEPSTVVLHRLIQAATRSQDVRSIVAAQLMAHRKD